MNLIASNECNATEDLKIAKYKKAGLPKIMNKILQPTQDKDSKRDGWKGD